MMIVAEMSSNHNGSIDRAFAIIEAASYAGATHVKFQTFTPKKMAVPYKIQSGVWKGRDLIDLYKQAHTPWGWHKELFEYSRMLGLIPFSSPFDSHGVEFLESLDCPIYKIASFELVDLQLVETIAKTKKPIIMSTGQAESHEIRAAVNTAKDNGCEDISLLHCVSSYPTEMKDVNLKTMNSLQKFGCRVGISDHTLGTSIPIAATALGAEVIEKHITMKRSDGGLDSSFSLEPDEFKAMVAACKDVSEALGEIRYYAKGQKESLRRSLYYAHDLKKGTVLESHHIKTCRPNLGLNPLRLDQTIGTKLTQDVRENEPVQIR